MTETAERVTVAVLTYRRLHDLAELLPELISQAAQSSAESPACVVEVLVVDNDPDASAQEQVTTFAGHPVRYVCEPHPGIAAARNRALDESYGSDILIFIDDDERPVAGWLRALLTVRRQTRASGVVGPVISKYSEVPDEWITAGDFFRRRRLPTGTLVEVAATNNLLLDMVVVRRLGVRFDERFGLSGGSDTLFTRAIVNGGGTLVWCDEAVVHDIVPASRLSRQWVLQRAYRSGNSWSRTAIVLSTGASRRTVMRLTLSARSGLRIAGGAALALTGTATRSPRFQAKGFRTLNRGLGMFSGAWGHVYSEYRRDA